MNTPLISRQFLLPAAFAAGLLAASAWSAFGRPGAAASPAAYQYVGLDRSIARVDPASGRIWVLQFQDAGRLSLLASPAEPGWAWREVRVESEEPTVPAPKSGRPMAP